jgi:hypothetical protein
LFAVCSANALGVNFKWLGIFNQMNGILYARRILRATLFACALFALSGFTECYKPVTTNDLPKHIKTIAVPAFQNNALKYKIDSRFAEAVAREIIHRGRGIRVVNDREHADAVVDGVVKRFDFSGVLLDNVGRARIFEVTITAAVTVRDQVQNRMLYDNQNYVFRGEFEFSSDPRTFFNEEDPAVERLAREFAQSLVSTLINGYGVNKQP